MLNAHSTATTKRGEVAVPSEVEGKILETRPNRDGSITATTNRGTVVTYDPDVYHPFYVQQRDRTFFGLLPQRTFSASGFWTRAPGQSGFRTSLTYTELPYGKLPNPDAKGSTTASLSQSTNWAEPETVSKGFGFNVNHQFNSDSEPLQYSGSFSVSAYDGATRQLLGSATIARTINSRIALSANTTYIDGGHGSNGWTTQGDLSYAVTPQLVIYVDGQPPTSVQGLAPWDIGLQAGFLPNLSFTFEYDQGQIWFMGLSHRFKTR